MRSNHFASTSRVLILAPTAKDASITQTILKDQGIESIVCADIAGICAHMAQDADAAIVTEESILRDRARLLERALRDQPPWSDFPLIVLTAGQGEHLSRANPLEAVGNMTLLGRPLNIYSLITTLKSALRDRKRQYSRRDYLLERVQAEQELRESQQQFKDMADSINQMIWVTRPDGYHEYYNKRWYDYTGVPLGSTDGEAWNGMFHPDDQERAWARWRHSLATGEPYEVEYRLRRADGVYRWALGRAECVRDADGRIVKWYGTCTDIEELIDARRSAEEASLAKSEFLANMSHEIRTPMNAVIGLSTILAHSTPLTPKQKEFIKTLQMSADSLLGLINDLLDISKIEARSIELEEAPFSIFALVGQVVSMINVKALEKHLHFRAEFNCERLRDCTLLGDTTRVRQILNNLCSNAVKFTETGGVTVEVTCQDAAEPGVELVRIAVRDTGIGIPEDKLNSVFEKFVQADSSITRRYGGSGLGLAITKTLTEVMGGTITVESRPGVGSTFTVQFPFKVERKHTGTPTPAPDKPSVKPVRATETVLLAEDYAPNVMVATAFLEEFGYACDVVANGQEALNHFKTGRYKTILMDVQMPVMNGLEATQEIRAHEQKHALPPAKIIGMTANSLAGDERVCLDAGMDFYISKPFDPSDLALKLRLKNSL